MRRLSATSSICIPVCLNPRDLPRRKARSHTRDQTRDQTRNRCRCYHACGSIDCRVPGTTLAAVAPERAGQPWPEGSAAMAGSGSGASPQPFGDLLRRSRLAAGLTQAELAERAGLSVRGINDLERGARRAPHKETVALLADALALQD